MQKVLNVLTIISFGAVTAATAAGVYVYTNRQAIIDNVKSEVTSMIMDRVQNMDLDLPAPAVSNPVAGSGEGVIGIPVEPSSTTESPVTMPAPEL